MIADPLAAAEHGSESQVLAEGLAASAQVDLAQVDSAQAGLDEAGSDQVDLDVPVWGNQAAQAGLVPAWVVAPVADPACRAGMVGLVADCHRDEFGP